MLTGQPLVPSEMAANDGTMLGWLIAMAGHKDYHTVPSATRNTKYFDENGTAHSSTYASDPDIAYSRLGSFKLGIHLKVGLWQVEWFQLMVFQESLSLFKHV